MSLASPGASTACPPQAAALIRVSTLCGKHLSGREWHERFESDLARRVRLGLFFAARPAARRHNRKTSFAAPGWSKAIPMRGLAIAHDALWDVQPPGYFNGTVTIRD